MPTALDAKLDEAIQLSPSPTEELNWLHLSSSVPAVVSVLAHATPRANLSIAYSLLFEYIR